MKRLLVLLYVGVFLTSAACFYKYWLGNRPSDQPNTVWVSEDQSVYIEIDENENGTGYIIKDGQRTDFIYSCAAVTIELYPPDAIDYTGSYPIYPEEGYEVWHGTFLRDDRFTAEVVETTFFKVGQKITFYRVD